MENEKLIDAGTDFRRGKLENVGGPIALEKVRVWTGNYRKMNDKTVTTAHFFGRKTIEKILSQRDCTGIRIHYAIDDRGHKQLILSGVDHLGKDQLPKQKHVLKEASEHHEHLMEAEGDESSNDNQLWDQSWPCPETKGCPGTV